jgi:hypothetical protein
MTDSDLDVSDIHAGWDAEIRELLTRGGPRTVEEISLELGLHKFSVQRRLEARPEWFRLVDGKWWVAE